MLDIVLLGLNHKTAPVELRELLAFSKEEAVAVLEGLQKCPDINEVMLISTCNRVEVLLTTSNITNAVNSVKTYTSEFKKIPISKFEQALYMHDGEEAVRHVFRVASSLDSMMVGEPQILGQIKDAYLTAILKKTSGVILNRLLHKTFFVAKRVRSETGIGDHAVSISYAAIELAKKIFGNLEGKKVLLIGAGEMAELAVEHLVRNRAGEIFVANRTFERGVELSNRFKGKAIRIEEIPDCLKLVDIIISSTGSPNFVIVRDQVKGVMRSRRNRPIFFIDIAVPRDIDPDINRLNNSYVYDIDDLKGVIEENIKDRNRESIKGERIVDEAVISFQHWFESLDVVPTIVALRNKIDSIAKSEVSRTLHSLEHLSDNDCQAIYRMTDSLINKILHDPTLFLKKNGCHGGRSAYIDLTRKLFKLDD
ncbi:MAG: glutamyl-tRNA reductase [Proteobacteria bacterium]|nr:glutamyl-tRNA reductase [Desulfobacteraceae bacterium]MBU3981488.1 glutamyl-tRNA reductase [Pseudomonadota bacterium]MBU4013475.1 glutamyl-tRNA reductase [Pseudomonadota bacterium]MBU4067040.1 glutamyl-tRNA reductase [Pseudomonadota bacterium]MBU4101034.1 glutamyl-tRNA reductase [Pseudomonadota bacterium]